MAASLSERISQFIRYLCRSQGCSLAIQTHLGDPVNAVYHVFENTFNELLVSLLQLGNSEHND